MPLGAREVLVAIRARDVTSRILREIGGNFGKLAGEANSANRALFNTGAAMTAIGVGMAGVGAAGLKFFNDATDAFVEYSRQAALTKTQVDQVGVSVADLAEIGKRVADRIPVPFEQMQTALFDIFSTMDVTLQESEMLLTAFSKAAVAGQTDLQTAGRATISVLNAWQMEASEVNRVNDIMFELVRKGRGSYQEFATTIGRAIPAAVAAGQEFETLAGAMAFLTRRGLSTAMASTSVARAMELLTKPKVRKELEAIGVSVVDAEGNFRSMNDIVTQLAVNEGWAKMAAPERKKLFTEIFGEGTIQARRFFDLAIPGYESFNQMTGFMIDSSGTLGEAYKTMFDEPAMKAQLLANKYDILKVEIGEKLLPAKIKLIETVTKLIDMWNGLSEGTRSLIIKLAAGAAAFLTIGGVALTLVGAFLMLAGVVGGVATAFAILTVVPVAIAAIVAVTILLIKNWEKVKEVAGEVWQFIQSKWGTLFIPIIGPAVAIIKLLIRTIRFLVENWDEIMEGGRDAFNAVKDAVMAAWETLKQFAAFVGRGFASAWDAVKSAWGSVVDAWNVVVEAFQDAFEWFERTLGPGLAKIWEALTTAWNEVTDEIKETLDALRNYWNIIWGFFDTPVREAMKILSKIIDVAWDTIVTGIKADIEFITDAVRVGFNFIVGIVKAVWPVVETIITTVLDIVVVAFETAFDAVKIVVTTGIDVAKAVIEAGLAFIMDIWQNVWTFVGDYVMAAWNLIVDVVTNTINIISNIIQLVMNLIQGDWGEAWDNIKQIFISVWNVILAFLHTAWEIIVSAVKNGIAIIWAAMQAGLDLIRNLWTIIWNGIISILKLAWETLKSLVKIGVDFLKNIISTGITAIKNAWFVAWEGVKNTAKAAWDWVKSQAATFKDGIVGIFNALKDTMHNIWRAIRDTAKNVWEGVKTAIKNAINGVIGLINKLIGGINTVLGLIPGLDIKIPSIPKLAEGGTLAANRAALGGISGGFLGGFAAGGRIGGGFLTNKPMAIVGEGKTNYPEFVIPTDPRHRRNAFALYDQLGNMLEVPGLQFGGLVNAFKKGTGFVTDLAKKGVGALGGLARTMLTKAFDPIVKKVIDQLGNLPNVFYIPRVAKGIANAIWDWVKGADKGLPVEDRGAGTARGSGFGGLQPGFAAQIKQLISMYGGHLVSGWRSGASQRRLYAAYVARGFAPPRVAKPGTSMHERGLAADMSPPYGALSRAAHKLGLKAPVPGEPWHWQPGWTTSRSLYERGGVLGYAAGAWKVLQDQLAGVHRGEMIIPARPAEMLRRSATQDGGDSRGANFNFYGDVTFGSDMQSATSDLDFWSRAKTSGV